MRQCPECQRVYYDEKLNFCLDDGAELLHGPASFEPATVRLPSTGDESTKIYAGATDASGATTRNSSQMDPAPRPVSTRLLLAICGIAVLLLGGFFGYRYFASAGSDRVTAIAVMPFVNESGNADVEYLSDGISETLINSLTQVPSLTVKPRSSAFRYKGRESDAKTIGSELGVGAIVTGRLTQRGDDITLFIRLVDTATENQIWGQQYQRKLANLVSLQSDIARDVSENLRTRLTSAGEQRAQKNYSANPEAYRLYLQGRFHWNKRSRRDVELAIDFFRQSTMRDPRFAPAFAGLADSLSIIGGYTGATAHETIADARSAALTSLSLDPESAEAHIALGTILFYYDHNFAEAEREFTRAIELDPKNGHARQMLGLLLISRGRNEEGLECYRQALELEPVSLPFNRGYALVLSYSRKFDESIAQFRKTIELDPSFGLAYFGFAYTLSLQGKFAEAVEAYAKGVEVAGDADRAVQLRRSFASGGWKTFLGTLLDRPALVGATPTPHFIRALYVVQLGDKERAFAELNKSYEDREGFIPLVKVHPGLDVLRDDARYQELVRKVGLIE
jgi:TolB-like protein/Flp pilus assembly protein TadD